MNLPRSELMHGLSFEFPPEINVEKIATEAIDALMSHKFGDPTEVAEFLRPSLIWDFDTNIAVLNAIAQGLEGKDDVQSETIFSGIKLLQGNLQETIMEKKKEYEVAEKAATIKARTNNQLLQSALVLTDTRLENPETALTKTVSINEAVQIVEKKLAVLRLALKNDVNQFFQLCGEAIHDTPAIRGKIIEDKAIKNGLKEFIFRVFHLYTANKDATLLKTIAEIWGKVTVIGFFTNENLKEWGEIDENSLHDFLAHITRNNS